MSVTVNMKQAAGAAAAVLVLAVTVSACGGTEEGTASAASPSVAPTPTERLESMTGTIIIQQAQADFAKVTSVKMTGFEIGKDGKSTYTLTADRQGNCAGSFSTDGHGGAEVIRSNGQLLLKMDAQMLTKVVSAEAAQRFKDSWIKFPRTETLGIIGQLCDLNSVPLFGDGTSAEDVMSNGADVVGGKKVVSLFSTARQSPGYTGEVAAEGPVLPVRLTHIDEDVEVNFSDWNAGPVKVTAPPAEQVVDSGTALKR